MLAPSNCGCVALVLTGIKLVSHAPMATPLHIPQLVNEYFNGNVEHVSTDRLWCMPQTSQFGQTSTNENNVALFDNCNFDENVVTVGAIFLAIVTFIWGSQRMCSVGTFSFSWCTVDGTWVYSTTKEALVTGHAIPVTSQFFPFVAMTNDPTLLWWTGRFGSEGEFRNGYVVFFGCRNGCRWSFGHSSGNPVLPLCKPALVPNCR